MQFDEVNNCHKLFDWALVKLKCYFSNIARTKQYALGCYTSRMFVMVNEWCRKSRSLSVHRNDGSNFCIWLYYLMTKHKLQKFPSAPLMSSQIGIKYAKQTLIFHSYKMCIKMCHICQLWYGKSSRVFVSWAVALHKNRATMASVFNSKNPDRYFYIISSICLS